MNNLNYFLPKDKKIKKAAIFLSGSGTNAVKVIEYWKETKSKEWEPAVLITDAPDKSKAGEISKSFNIPLISLDIKKFYNERGQSKVSILTEEGQKIRTEWTDVLRKKISEYKINFGILAGFVPLSNITADFPCLNIHPGDLTVEQNGKRLLVGLHTIPVELSIINGYKNLRSSVIIAQPYTGSGGEMDSGPILGISPAVAIDYNNYSIDELKNIYSKRPAIRPAGGYKDALEDIAKINQENLKVEGDWVVFPRAVDDFAKNKFAVNSEDSLFYFENNAFIPIKTVVYSKNVKKPI